MNFSKEFKKKFIVDLKGKEFVQYGGLVELSKQEGMTKIETQLLQAPSKDNGEMAIVHARVYGKDSSYDGIGDCDNKNAPNNFIAPHRIRMAETRAKGRAMRDFLGIDMVMLEELGADMHESATNNHTTKKPENKPKKDRPATTNKKKPAGKVITEAQRKRMWAISKGNKELLKTALETHDYESSKDVTMDDYEAVCKTIEDSLLFGSEEVNVKEAK